MKVGRPTKYKKEYIERVDEYLKTCSRNQTKLPKRVDIALLLGVDEDTLNRWANKKKEFRGALMRVDAMQKSSLIDDSFYGGHEINSNVGIFLLKVNHQMVEKSAVDITSGNKPLPAPIIDVRSNNSDTQTSGTEKKD